jgi:hypothetical protein
MTRSINTILAIGIIAVLAAVIGGVIWWQISQQAEEIAPVNEQTGQQLTEQPSDRGQAPGEQNIQEQTTDELAGWKTYRNERYGFEFRYPKDWVVKTEDGKVTESGNDISYGSEHADPNFINFFIGDKNAKDSYNLQLNESSDFYYYPFLVIAIRSTIEKDAKTYVYKSNELGIAPGNTLTVEPTEVGGMPAVKAYNCAMAFGAIPLREVNQEEYIVIKNGYAFDLYMPYLCHSDYFNSESDFNKFKEQFDSVDKQYHPTFEQIIPTFKFTK